MDQKKPECVDQKKPEGVDLWKPEEKMCGCWCFLFPTDLSVDDGPAAVTLTRIYLTLLYISGAEHSVKHLVRVHRGSAGPVVYVRQVDKIQHF